MATVVRPPIVVPRPADEAPWFGRPTASGTIRILSAFQPRQPTFRPGEHDSDVRPWQWEPLRNIALLTPNVAKPFRGPAWVYAGDQADSWRGAPTQAWALVTPAAAPPPPWVQAYRPHLDASDAWQWRAGSAPITVLVAPAAPFRPVIWQHPADEMPQWRGAPAYSLALYQTLPFRVSYPSGIDDVPLWQWQMRPTAALLTPPPQPFRPLSWRFDVHEAGTIKGAPLNRLALNPPPIPPMPFQPRRWPYDDAVRIEVTWWAPPNIAVFHAGTGATYAITQLRAYSAATNLVGMRSTTMVKVSRRS